MTHFAVSIVMLVLIVAGTTTVIVIVFVEIVIIIERTIRMINTDTNTDSNGSRRNST